MTKTIATLVLIVLGAGCGTAKLEEQVKQQAEEIRKLRLANTKREAATTDKKQEINASAGNRQQLGAGNPAGFGQSGYRMGVAPAFVHKRADAYVCTLDEDENDGGGRRLKLTNNTPNWIAPKISGRPVIMGRGFEAQAFAVLAPGQSCYTVVMPRRRHNGDEIPFQLSANAYAEMPISADPESPLLDANRTDWTKNDTQTNFLLSITIGNQSVRHFTFEDYHFHG